MRFFQSVFAAAAFVTAALATPAINSISSSGPYQVGQTYTITYTATAPVTLKLRQGDSNNLQDVAVLTSSGSSGSYAWTVDKSLPNGSNYALQIIDSTGNNYWGPITISGSTATASSSAAASSSASASSASSASSKASTITAASTLSTAASASISSSVRANSTFSSATLSASSSGATLSASGTKTGSASATGSSGAPQSTGAASQMGSSMALVLGAVAAMAYLN